MIADPTLRFSDRVDHYVKHRPGYPPEVLDVLRVRCGLMPEAPVADIGSGTGIFSEGLLKHGNPVFGVEPNPEMRQAAARSLAGYKKFVSVDGTAEATMLPASCVAFITAAQAFHWFDRARTLAEFARILRPVGWVVLIWNARRLDSTPFLQAYENLLQTYGTNYRAVTRRHPDLAQVRAFFGDNPVALHTLESRQLLDHEGLWGRFLSSSYAPPAGHPNHEPMRQHLTEIFDQHQQAGRVSFDYDTLVYYAQLRRP